MAAHTEQITVILDPDLRNFTERAAAREGRSLSGQVRYWVAQVARREVPERQERQRKRVGG
jgi:hypothetical protein